MLSQLRFVGRGLAFLSRSAQRHPRRTVAAFLLVVTAAATAGWGYARYQWRAAQAALAGDRPHEATARLAVPLAVWWWDPDVRLLAARASRVGGDLPAAEAHLNRGLKLAGGATERLQLEFLLLRIQTGELDQVAPPLIDAVEKGHPESALIMNTLAVAYVQSLRYKPAFACLSRWIELQPDSAKAYHLRGWVLERLNKHKEASADYHKALELAPESVPIRLRVAEMLLEDHQAPEAVPHLEELYRRAPDDPKVQARLGMCRFLQGRTDEARQLMEAAVPRLPHDPTLLIHLARLDLQDGRPADAERRLRIVIDTDPTDTEAWYTLITAVQAQGRAGDADMVLRGYERAKTALDRTNKLLQEVADSPTAGAADYAELGDLLLQAKQEQRGLYWLYEALDRDPENQRAHRALATHFERTGNADKAAAHRRQIPAANAPQGQTANDTPVSRP